MQLLYIRKKSKQTNHDENEWHEHSVSHTALQWKWAQKRSKKWSQRKATLVCSEENSSCMRHSVSNETCRHFFFISCLCAFALICSWCVDSWMPKLFQALFFARVARHRWSNSSLFRYNFGVSWFNWNAYEEDHQLTNHFWHSCNPIGGVLSTFNKKRCPSTVQITLQLYSTHCKHCAPIPILLRKSVIAIHKKLKFFF